MGLRVVQLAVLIALAGSPAAAVAADEIHVDPGSPAGKEYGFPLDQARREAGGRGGSGTGSSLFGAGIRPIAHASAGGSSPGTGRGGATQRSGRPLTGTGRPPAGAIPAGATGAGGGHIEIALAAAVVLLGGGLGLLLRWRARRG